MQPYLPPQRPPASSAGGVAARLLGCLLLIPAVVLTVITLVVPTVETISASLREETFLRGAESTYVGFDNYDALFDRSPLWASLGFALSLMLGPIIIALVVAPLVAAALNWAGGWARLTARIALSLTLVAFSPVAFAIAWRRTFRDEPETLGDPDLVGEALRWSVAMMTFGALVTVGVMIFLPAFRAREQRRSVWPALFTTAGVAALGLLAIGLQQFTVPLVMTGFGPAEKTLTPVGLMYEFAFRGGDVGRGAAVATVLLVLLAVLGVAAVLLIILTRLRFSLLPSWRDRSADSSPTLPRANVNPGAIVVAALVLVGVVVLVVFNAQPWLDALSGEAPDTPPGMQQRTWSSAALGAVVSVGVAYLAALGISGLRPLGRHSEWLLLPFAPWLFVGVAPLSVEFFRSAQEEGEIDTYAALRPPILISVVSLMLLALLCRGQAQRWQQQVATGAPAGPTFIRTVALPTLPLAGFLLVAVVFVNAQDLLWPLLAASSPENGTATLALFRAQGELTASFFAVGSTTPLPAVVLGLVAFVAVQVFHLDRMATATGRSDEPAAQDPTPGMPPGMTPGMPSATTTAPVGVNPAQPGDLGDAPPPPPGRTEV
ncbi:hypothetical protein [Actinophytocola sp.]|uniref:hypothetical protein n=1 Tax=Actinophytocola sp. TaxID=1872138 RepID=UPI003D6B1F09